jgi:hypothetical protein
MDNPVRARMSQHGALTPLGEIEFVGVLHLAAASGQTRPMGSRDHVRIDQLSDSEGSRMQPAAHGAGGPKSDAGRSKRKSPARGSIFVGAHDGEHTCRLVGIGGIFGATLHVGGIVIHLEEVPDAGYLEAAEVVFAMRVIVRREFVEVANAFKDDREGFLRQRRDAPRHDDLAASERAAEAVVEEGDLIHRPPPPGLRFCTATYAALRTAGNRRRTSPCHTSVHSCPQRAQR